MPCPECPQEQNFNVITGFITPGSDFPGPHPLDASISVDVFDPNENNERIRVVEISDPFDVVVDWAICGPLAAAMCGCWEVKVYIDDIDGVAPSSGLLGETTVDLSTESSGGGSEPGVKRCYTYPFHFPAGTVGVDPASKTGVYSLVVVITLRQGGCDANPPGSRLGDFLGFAQIPVLAFFNDV